MGIPALPGESLNDAHDPKDEITDIEDENQQAEQNGEEPSNQRNMREDL